MMVAFEDEKVFYATLFTASNIQTLIEKDNDAYFWAQDMFIVKDLSKKTIKEAVIKAIKDDYFLQIFDNIGTIKNVYGENMTFEQLKDAIL